MKKVLFLGLGYIGLPTAAVAATHGYQVIGVDVNPVVVDTINQGRIHIVEPDLAKVVKEAVCNGAPGNDETRAGGCFLCGSAYPFQAEPPGGYHVCGVRDAFGNSFS